MQQFQRPGLMCLTIMCLTTICCSTFKPAASLQHASLVAHEEECCLLICSMHALHRRSKAACAEATQVTQTL